MVLRRLFKIALVCLVCGLGAPAFAAKKNEKPAKAKAAQPEPPSSPVSPRDVAKSFDKVNATVKSVKDVGAPVDCPPKRPSAIDKVTDKGYLDQEYEVSVLTEDDANEVFRRIKAWELLMLDENSKNFAVCAPRAQMIVSHFDGPPYNLKMGKTWVGQGWGYKAFLPLRENLDGGGERKDRGWPWHVAAYIKVRGADGKDTIKVLDPLADRLLSEEEWQNRVTPSTWHHNFYRSGPGNYSYADVGRKCKHEYANEYNAHKVVKNCSLRGQCPSWRSAPLCIE